MATDPELLRIANDSGFPLQIALRHSIEAASDTHGWHIRHSEHAWLNAADGQSGFIDLVVRDRNNYANIVVECKRVRNSIWLFFNDTGATNPRRDCKSWVTRYDGSQFSHFDWYEVPIDPPSPEGRFCAVRGQSTNDKNTFLERVSGELTSSTEALAVEERDYRPENQESLRFYFNAIVTTASLKVAEFALSSLSLADGTLSTASFHDVPFVRVRKQFSMRPAYLTPTDWLRRHDDRDPDYLRENTVFVINAYHLNEFLTQFNIPDSVFGKFFGKFAG